MKKFMFAFVFLLGFVAQASAQGIVIPGDKIGWNQAAATLAEASSLTYLVQVDALAPTVVSPASVTCTGTASPYLCTTTFPAATPGAPHTVKVAARLIVTVDGKPTNVDSAYSAPLSFQFVVVPGVPTNVQRIPGSGGTE